MTMKFTTAALVLLGTLLLGLGSCSMSTISRPADQTGNENYIEPNEQVPDWGDATASAFSSAAPGATGFRFINFPCNITVSQATLQLYFSLLSGAGDPNDVTLDFYLIRRSDGITDANPLAQGVTPLTTDPMLSSPSDDKWTPNVAALQAANLWFFLGTVNAAVLNSGTYNNISLNAAHFNTLVGDSWDGSFTIAMVRTDGPNGSWIVQMHTRNGVNPPLLELVVTQPASVKTAKHTFLGLPNKLTLDASTRALELPAIGSQTITLPTGPAKPARKADVS